LENASQVTQSSDSEKFATLERTIKRLESQNRFYRESIDSLNAKAQLMNDDHIFEAKEKESEIVALCEEIRFKNNTISSFEREKTLGNKVASLEALREISDLREETQSKDAKISSLELQKVLARKNSTIEALRTQSEIAILQNSLQIYKTQLDKTKATADKSEERAHIHELQLQFRDLSLADITIGSLTIAEGGSLGSIIREEQIKDLREYLLNNRAKFKALRTDIGNYTAKISSLETLLKSLTNDTLASLQDREAHEAKNWEYQRRIAEYESKDREKDKTISELVTELSARGERGISKDAKIAELEKMDREWESLVHELKAESSIWKDNSEREQERITELNKQNGVREHAVANLRVEVAAKTEEIIRKNAEIARLQDQSKEQQRVAAGLGVVITTRTAEITQKDARIAELETMLPNQGKMSEF